jgi:hypothetical protein
LTAQNQFMKPSTFLLFSMAAFLLIASGCASPDVNSPKPRANEGYVDFYSDTDAELCWEVREIRAPAGDLKTICSEFKPVEKDVLRLAFAPGHHRFRVTFLNRVITSPAEVEVDVQNGKITPVRVTLMEAGSTSVKSKEVSAGGTPYGRWGRRTVIKSDSSVRYDLSAEAGAPVQYQPKEQMPYAH